MALKTLMLRKRLEDAQKNVAVLEQRSNEFATRETELETAIGEIDAEAEDAEEQRSAVNDAIETFEAERTAHETALAEARNAVDTIQAELDAIEEVQPVETEEIPTTNERKEAKKMEMLRRFNEMTLDERTAFCEREDVRTYLDAVRTNAYQSSNISTGTTSVTGAGLLVPDTMLELIRLAIPDYSKLLKYVRLRRIAGTGRVNVADNVVEAVWTEMVAKLNAVTLGFSQIEIDGYKVGCYINIPNATLEDAAYPELAGEIIDAFARGIGLALDKAILFGTGTKMPTGIEKGLVHKFGIASTKTGIDIFKELVVDGGKIDPKYALGQQIWVMNNHTYTTLKAEAMSINAAGAIVTGMGNQMPVIGGQVEILDFVPDNYIYTGFFGLYLLGERAGMKTEKTTELGFIEDTTYFKATARYDGKPVDVNAFAGIRLGNASYASPSITFAADTANAGE